MPLEAAARWLRGAWRHFLQPEEVVAFPAGGSPSLRALQRAEPRGSGKWDVRASRGCQRAQRLGQPERSRWGTTPARLPDPSGPPPPNPPPSLEGLQHAGDATGLLKQKLPRTDTTLCGLLTRLRGPSITSIDPGVSGGLRKGSDGAGAHGGKQK